jgi:hypothetical protein
MEPAMTDPDHQVSPGSGGVPPPLLTEREARAGVTLNRMRYVLGISLALVVILLIVIYLVA